LAFWEEEENGSDRVPSTLPDIQFDLTALSFQLFSTKDTYKYFGFSSSYFFLINSQLVGDELDIKTLNFV